MYRFLLLAMIAALFPLYSAQASPRQAQNILDFVVAEYKSEFSKQGKKLIGEIVVSDVENAVYQIGPANYVRLIIYAGLVGANEMNDLGLVLVACHELGHVYSSIINKKGIALEGEADYFAAAECAAKIFRRLSKMLDIDLPGEILTQCRNSSFFEAEICEKINAGGFAVSKLRSRVGSQPEPSFLTPDPLIVTESSDAISVQCGLDTFRAGSMGLPRPLCWFHQPFFQ